MTIVVTILCVAVVLLFLFVYGLGVYLQQQIVSLMEVQKQVCAIRDKQITELQAGRQEMLKGFGDITDIFVKNVGTVNNTFQDVWKSLNGLYELITNKEKTRH